MPAMKRLALILLFLPACKLANTPRLVSVDPDHAFTDGCTAITISGSKLDTTATATIGGNAIESWTAAEENPDRGERAQDVGFKYYGVSPAASDPAGGFVDVVLTLESETYTLDRGFYYKACPGDFMVEGIEIGESHAVGDSIPMTGCGIDVGEVTGGLYSPADYTLVAAFDIVSDCRGAVTHFDVPDVPVGTYLVSLAHTNGAEFGDLCDPADTGLDTAIGCNAVYLTVAAGGAK